MLYLATPFFDWQWNVPSVQAPDRAFRAEVLEDLKSVTHVILPKQIWSAPTEFLLKRFWADAQCRTKLKAFVNLQRVSLALDKILIRCDQDTERVFLGYNNISDPFYQQPLVLSPSDTFANLPSGIRKVLLETDNKPSIEKIAQWLERRPEALSNKDAILFLSGFERPMFNKLKQTIKIPDVRVVELEHVVSLPRVVEEITREDIIPLCCR